MAYDMTNIMVDHMNNHMDGHYAGYMDKHIAYHMIDNISYHFKKLAVSPRSQTENDDPRNVTPSCFLNKKKRIVRVMPPLTSESSLDYGPTRYEKWSCSNKRIYQTTSLSPMLFAEHQ
jgi:hypothetical protein